MLSSNPSALLSRWEMAQPPEPGEGPDWVVRSESRIPSLEYCILSYTVIWNDKKCARRDSPIYTIADHAHVWVRVYASTHYYDYHGSNIPLLTTTT